MITIYLLINRFVRSVGRQSGLFIFEISYHLKRDMSTKQTQSHQPSVRTFSHDAIGFYVSFYLKHIIVAFRLVINVFSDDR